MTEQCLLSKTVQEQQKSPTLPCKGSPLQLSKSIMLKDSILKRLDLNRNDLSEEQVKNSQLYQQMERRIEATKQRQEQ